MNTYSADSFQVAAISDVGLKRNNNEDKWLVSFPQNRREKKKKGYLFIVADGMGGCAAGEVASSLAAIEVETYYYSAREDDTIDVLKRAILHAHSQININSRANKTFAGMGTTFTAIAILGERLYLAHVGDSRAYLIRNNIINQLTHDHTLIEWLLSNGKISSEQAHNHPQRHILTQAVGGTNNDPVPETAEFIWMDNDILLLCSDGLHSLVDDEEISGLISQNEDLEHGIRKLVDLANQRGGNDNITVVAVRKSKQSKSIYGILKNHVHNLLSIQKQPPKRST